MPHGELKPEARSNGEGPMALVRELQDVTIPGLKAALAAEHAAREQAEAQVRVRDEELDGARSALGSVIKHQREALAAEQAAHAETRSELDGARSSLGGVIQHQRGVIQQLFRYAWHQRGCSINPNVYPSLPCDCGFNEFYASVGRVALAASREGSSE